MREHRGPNPRPGYCQLIARRRHGSVAAVPGCPELDRETESEDYREALTGRLRVSHFPDLSWFHSHRLMQLHRFSDCPRLITRS